MGLSREELPEQIRMEPKSWTGPQGMPQVQANGAKHVFWFCECTMHEAGLLHCVENESQEFKTKI